MPKVLAKIVDVKPQELRALWLAFVFNFVILAGYYILRPIREEIGATSGVENLPWMYTATLIGMLIANALFAAIVSRMSRRKFLPHRLPLRDCQSFHLFHPHALRAAELAMAPGALVFCLGQRLQSFRDDAFLGLS